MAIQLSKGTYREFPPVGLDRRPFRRRWTFTNATDQKWTSLVILTGPSSFFGPLDELIGDGTGDPPNLESYQVISPRQVAGGDVDTEKIRITFQPVEQGQSVKVRIDFDGPFEAPEFVQFVFCYTDEDGVAVPVNGIVTEGTPLPVPQPSPTRQKVGSALLGSFSRTEGGAMQPERNGTALAIGRVRRDVTLLRTDLASERLRITARDPEVPVTG
ncbi:MAG: hypothetical protein R3247_04635 [Rhodothermales bacterium]|nr:hypothetical protein [Rhodothermales bacterium]